MKKLLIMITSGILLPTGYNEEATTSNYVHGVENAIYLESRSGDLQNCVLKYLRTSATVSRNI